MADGRTGVSLYCLCCTVYVFGKDKGELGQGAP